VPGCVFGVEASTLEGAGFAAITAAVALEAVGARRGDAAATPTAKRATTAIDRRIVSPYRETWVAASNRSHGREASRHDENCEIIGDRWQTGLAHDVRPHEPSSQELPSQRVSRARLRFTSGEEPRVKDRVRG